MRRRTYLALLAGSVLLSAGCGDLVERTEVLTFQWDSSSMNCADDGQSFQELDPAELRPDLAVREVEVVHWELESESVGEGSISLRDFGLAEPDETNPFLRLIHAGCNSDTLPLSDSYNANACLDRMRLLANDRTEQPYIELLEALNERDGLQVRGTQDCSGSVDVAWSMYMRVWTWQRRVW